MRPRVFPAEDFVSAIRKDKLRPSFNEAAGIPRGRREAPADDPRDGLELQ